MSNKLYLNLIDRQFPRTENQSEKTHWLFFGRDYGRLLSLKQQAPVNFIYVDIGQLLYKTSYELRRPYLNYISTLSQELASLAWWISPIAEKNVMASPVYLYVCYLRVLITLLKQQLAEKNICIFIESRALLKTIRELKEFQNYDVKICFQPRLGYLLPILANLLRSIWHSCRRKWLAIKSKRFEKTPLARAKSPLILRRTWVAENNLKPDGTFQDSYFPGLDEYLTGIGKDVAVIPYFYSIKRSFYQSLLWFRQSAKLFLIPEDFYALGDYWQAFMIQFKSFLIFRREFNFQEFNLTYLYQESAVQVLFLPNKLIDTLYFFLMKRLSKRGLKISQVILPFENMAAEKPMILGTQSFLPESKIIGYQHPSLCPLLLSWYTTKAEAKVLPLPDKLVCSGRFFKEILLNEGYQEDKLISGPALRFQYLLKSNGQAVIAAKPRVVLLTLPITKSNIQELVAKVWLAVKDFSDTSLWIKPHPMTTDEVIKQIADHLSIPASAYNLIRGGMGDILPKATLLIGAGSATILDAVAYGLPAIRVRSDLDLTLDPMDWFSKNELSFVARTPKEIGQQIEQIFALNQSQLAKLKAQGKELIGKMFNPATEETLAAFCGDDK